MYDSYTTKPTPISALVLLTTYIGFLSKRFYYEFQIFENMMLLNNEQCIILPCFIGIEKAFYLLIVGTFLNVQVKQGLNLS